MSDADSVDTTTIPNVFATDHSTGPSHKDGSQNEQDEPRSGIPCVDSRVEIVQDPESAGLYLARHPVTSARILLTAVEAFAVESMRHPYNEIVLLAKCNARFSPGLSADELQELIHRLVDAALMTETAPRKHISSNRKDTDSQEDMSDATPSPSLAESERRDDSQEEDAISFRNHWSFFNPQSFLDSVLKVFGFLRVFKVFVPLLFVLSIAGVVSNLEIFVSDIMGVKSRVNFFDRILFTLFTINLMTQLFRGMTARYFGFKTPSFGMILVFGLLPRFNIRVTVPEDAPRRARLWFFGAPIYLRFLVFPLAIILWLATRGQATVLPLIGVSLAGVCFISIFFVANPLLGGAGYRFLSAYFEVPNLRKKAFARLKSLFWRQPPVVMQYVDRSSAVLVYGLLSLIFTLLLIGFVGLLVATRLESNFSGTGVMIFLILVVYLFFRFGYQPMVDSRLRRKAKSMVEEIPSKASIHPQTGLKKVIRRLRPRGRYVFLFALVCISFIPYRYESGGDAQVFPVAVASIYTESSQRVERVYFEGGEILKRATVVAELVNDREKYDVEKTLKDIEKKQEALNVLLSTPSPEEVALAKEALETARIQLRYSQQKLVVYEELYRKEAIPQVQYEEERQQTALLQQSVKSAQANLAYVKKKVNQHEIEAARIEIAILQDQLIYFQQMLERTKLKMPIDGQLVTMNLKSLQHSYLNTGDLFAEVEDTSTVRVEIKVPEWDSKEIRPGNPVTLKLQAFPDRSFNSEVRRVYPAIREGVSGNYTITDCIIVNENGGVKSGMTGFAKIQGPNMLAAEAFTRAIIRFFKIEVWSWIP